MMKEKFIRTKLPVRFMESIYKIIWSDEALKNLKEIINYLENNWTEKELKQFAKQLDKRLNSIERNPYLFQKINPSTNLRRSVLSKQTSIFYQIVDTNVRLITLFDNRQNPEQLTRKLA